MIFRLLKEKKALVAAAAAIIVAAVLSEALYVRALNKNADFEQLNVPQSAFSAWEFEDRGGGDYYALANNSYFEAGGLGGAEASQILVRLKTDESDVSTKLLFFTGRSLGVEGTYSVPLVKSEDGYYLAAADYERIDGIRIYPTELVRTVVNFDGITINPFAEVYKFSASRALLFAFLLAGALSLAMIIIDAAKKKKRPFGWGRLYFVLAALVSLAGYMAGGMFSAARALGNAVIPLLAALFSAAYWFTYLVAAVLKKFEHKVFAVTLALGAFICFASAPLQPPDETNHFLRAYALSKGELHFYADYEYPNEVKNLYDCFPAEYVNNVVKTESSTVPQSLSRYFETLHDDSKTQLSSNAQLVMPYIPAAAAMAAVSIFTDNALIMLWAARLVNVALFSLAALYAIKSASKFKAALALMIMLPLTVFMAASVSYDSMFLAALAAYLGTALKTDLKKRDAAIMLLSFGIMMMIKPLYLPLALLVLLNGADYFKTGFKKRWLLLAAVAAGAAFWALSLFYAGVMGDIPSAGALQWVDKSAQIKYVLSNPVRYLMVMLVDGYQNSYYAGGFGIFGSLDLFTYLTPYISPVVIAAVTLLSCDCEQNAKGKDAAVCLPLAAVMYALIVTSFYVTWSTLGSTSILGVQTRYFIPSVFMASAGLCAPLRSALGIETDGRKTENAVLLLLSVSLFIGAAEIFLGYYLT